MSKRPRARAARRKTVPSGRISRAKAPGSASSQEGPLQYKVVELSSVEESTIERTLNEWVRDGWSLDGIQFAMRESSKRPSMAFVLFTRRGEAAARNLEEGRARLHRLAEASEEPQVRPVPVSAYDRLRQLAGEEEETWDPEPHT
jgi:hypothetical protein